jgi:uncharacterized protein (DUF169 family)
MVSHTDLSKTLTDCLHLTQPPIAISFAEQVPAGVRTFEGTVAAGCRFWQEAAQGTFATVARQHDLCAIGVHTHNLGQTPGTTQDLGDALKVFADLGYVRTEDIPQIPVLKTSPKILIYGPLAESKITPDVVLIFVQADQSLILSEASQQMEGGLPPAMGRPACAVIPQAANTGRTALSLGCCGARAYLDVLTPDVALYAIPGPKLAEFTERVAALSKANAILTRFHTLRRRDVEAGRHPTVQESLAAIG